MAMECLFNGTSSLSLEDTQEVIAKVWVQSKIWVASLKFKAQSIFHFRYYKTLDFRRPFEKKPDIRLKLKLEPNDAQ